MTHIESSMQTWITASSCHAARAHPKLTEAVAVRNMQGFHRSNMNNELDFHGRAAQEYAPDPEPPGTSMVLASKKTHGKKEHSMSITG